MASSYLRQAGTPRQARQSESIPGTSQVPNQAGGYAWKIPAMDRLRRFLILGSEGGTYYATERDLTRRNIDGVRAALDEHGPDAVNEIVGISQSGRAPKQDPALYALAVACAHQDDATRRAATQAIPLVARTGTHLFHFAQFVQDQRGWGPALCKGISAWYERDDVAALAYQLVKYRQRDGWTHRDLLRLSHPKAVTQAHTMLFEWLCGRLGMLDGVLEDDPSLSSVVAYEAAQDAPTPQVTTELIEKFGNRLPREALNTDHLTSPEVWHALLAQGMPMTAMIRNLPTMTRLGVLGPMRPDTTRVVDTLRSPALLRRARIHPITVLGALITYASGVSARGSAMWQPLGQIVDALDEAFYLTFENAPVTNLRHLLAVDMSGSMMGGNVAGMPGLTPRVGAAAMALVTANTEPNYHVCGFTAATGGWAAPPGTAMAWRDSGITPLTISPRQRLDDVVREITAAQFGATDCALPMLYALDRGIKVDVFQVITDNETWAGDIHPAQALQMYRDRTGIPARLVVVAMTADEFSIADPNDRGMLDVCGFDTNAPRVIADFAAGRI